MDFGLFQKSREKVLILNCNFTQSLQSLIILLLLFKYFSLTKHWLQMFWMTWLLIFFQSLFKILHWFHLKFFFWGWKEDPTFYADWILISSSIINEFLAILTSSFELLAMPQELGGNGEILIWSHFFTRVDLKSKGINSFLINISASLMIINLCNCWCKWNFSSILYSLDFS